MGRDSTIESERSAPTSRPAVAASGLMRACHPEPTVAVTCFAMALSASTSRSAIGVVSVGAAVLAGQLSVGWHNDWLDAERDRQAARADKPVAQGVIGRRAVGWACATAAVAVVPLSLLSGWRAACAHLGGVALAWAYNAWLKWTPASIMPYAVAFPLLVAFVTLGLPGAPWPRWWALGTAGLLGCGAHLLNAVPDLADDLAAGVRGLPQRLGRPRSVRIAMVLLLSATALSELGPGKPGWLAAAAMTGAVVAIVVATVLGRRSGSRWLFRGALIVALIDVATLVAHRPV